MPATNDEASIPVLLSSTLHVTKGGRTKVTLDDFNASDQDRGDQIAFCFTDVKHGRFVMLDEWYLDRDFKCCTKRNIQEGIIHFVHDNSEYAPSFNIELWNGRTFSSKTMASITFTTTTMNSLEVGEGDKAKPTTSVTDLNNQDDELSITFSEVSGDDLHSTLDIDVERSLRVTDGDTEISAITFKYSDYKNGHVDLPATSPSTLIQSGTSSHKLNTAVCGLNDSRLIPMPSQPQLKIRSNIIYGLFAYCSNPERAIHEFQQADLMSAKICFMELADPAVVPPLYVPTVDDGTLSSDFSKAVVGFTESQEVSAEPSVSTKLALGFSAGIAGAGLVAGFLKLRAMHKDKVSNDSENLDGVVHNTYKA